MTLEEVTASLKALDPEFKRLHQQVDTIGAQARQPGVGRKHKKELLADVDALHKDLDAAGHTLSVLGNVMQGMKHATPVDPAIVYAEAIESRIAVARMRRDGVDGVPSDFVTEMAALIDAKSFYWSPTMTSVVKVSAAALPAATIVEPDLFPVLAGWWWFGADNSELIVSASPGDKVLRRVAALAWLRQEDRVWLAAFSADWPELPKRELHSVWQCTIELGRTLNDISMSANKIEDIKNIDVADMYGLLRFLVAGLLFIRQRVFITHDAVIGRGARKRVQNFTHESSINIVHLRKAETLRGHLVERTSATEFTCQWWVRGHWRQQPYKDGIRPRWIDPFIKGDPDKPMKAPSEKVFAVVR